MKILAVFQLIIDWQGRRLSLGSLGLSPGTFSDLLNGSFSQIAQKCNKNLHQKNSTPLSPGTISEAEPPLKIPIPSLRLDIGIHVVYVTI